VWNSGPTADVEERGVSVRVRPRFRRQRLYHSPGEITAQPFYCSYTWSQPFSRLRSPSSPLLRGWSTTARTERCTHPAVLPLHWWLQPESMDELIPSLQLVMKMMMKVNTRTHSL
jgi:hypothetical protein